MDIGHSVQRFLVVCHTEAYPMHIPKTKIVDADLFEILFAHSRGKGHQAIVEQFLGYLPQYKEALRGKKKKVSC